MINTGLVLDVPAQKETRADIRKKTEDYFRQRNVLPPVSLEALAYYASELINLNGWDSANRAFVMVCCGNAIWQPVVRTVPYKRRILLLPECMKDSASCRGEQDSLGLLCSACGSCNMPGILDMAEKLGYMTIVSEGTTIASRLIEEGKADAVIGVSCMEVLQKMYSSVNKYAVPGIGIPLLESGCRDTTTDIDLVLQELMSYRPTPGVRLLNLNYLKGKIASVFAAKRIDELMGNAGGCTEKLTREYLLSGGKRLRPMLAILAYEAFSQESSEDDLARLALSIECFHKASLIHDDIEDNDGLRYGRETLHASYGVPVAINAGDFLIGEGYRLIAEAGLEAGIIRQCIAVASGGQRLLSEGQGMELMAVRNREIFSVDEVIKVFDYKASTAFKVALLLGAIAGEADDASRKLLERFSHYIGIAYQIMDDIEDFKDPDGSIDLNKPSVFLSLLSARLPATDRILFQGAYCSGDVNMIRNFCDRYSIRSNATELLDKYLSLLRACLDEFRNPALKLALHEIVGKVFRSHI